MTHPNTITPLVAALVAVSAMLSACVTPPEVSLGQPATQGTVTVIVESAELMHLDLEGPQGAQQTEEPLLVVRLQVTNAGPDAVRYDLNWGAPASTQAQTPLLFVDPGPGVAPTSGVNVRSALLQSHRYLDDPVTAARAIAPAESVSDVLLFHRPPPGTTSLVLSVPPSVFGAGTKTPAYVRIPFSDPGEVAAPAAVGVGDVYRGDGLEISVTSATVEWVPLKDATGRDGYASGPLLKLNFRVTNSGTSTTEYVGASSNTAVPALATADGTPVPRATFGGGVAVPGLQSGAVQLGPGESLTNFMLFERPTPDAGTLRLLVPGKRFGRTGLARFDVPYTHADPPPPSDLTTPRVVESPTP